MVRSINDVSKSISLSKFYYYRNKIDTSIIISTLIISTIVLLTNLESHMNVGIILIYFTNPARTCVHPRYSPFQISA